MKTAGLQAWLVLFVLLTGGSSIAQERELEDAGEQLEELANEIDAALQNAGQQLEEWLEEHEAELEAWGERHSQEWEQWGERFEARMERWAEGHEKEWEQWSEKYSSKWEAWAENRESEEELTAKELGQWFERGLEMVSEMPLGETVDGVLKEGVGELKNAPWESLHELKVLFEESKGDVNALHHEEHGAEDFNSVVGKMQKLFAAEQDKLESDAKEKLKKLNELLSNSNLSDEQRQKVERYVEELREGTKKRQAEMREKIKAMRKRAKAIRAEVDKESDSDEDEEVDSDESVLDALRREVAELRAEVGRLKQKDSK